MKSGNPTKLILDTSIMASWEIAALLDALLAYPDAELKRLNDVVIARRTDQLRVTITAEPHRRKELIDRYPVYNPSSRTSIGLFAKKHINAQRAGLVFLGMIQETATGSPPTLDGSTIKPSFDWLVAYYWSDQRPADDAEDRYSAWIHSIEEREVRGRFRVAHLCAALGSLALQSAAESRSDEYDYQDLDFLREWVERAIEIAGHIRNTPALKNVAEKLIDIRWIEPKQDSVPSPSR